MVRQTEQAHAADGAPHAALAGQTVSVLAADRADSAAVGGSVVLLDRVRLHGVPSDRLYTVEMCLQTGSTQGRVVHWSAKELVHDRVWWASARHLQEPEELAMAATGEGGPPVRLCVRLVAERSARRCLTRRRSAAKDVALAEVELRRTASGRLVAPDLPSGEYGHAMIGMSLVGSGSAWQGGLGLPSFGGSFNRRVTAFLDVLDAPRASAEVAEVASAGETEGAADDEAATSSNIVVTVYFISSAESNFSRLQQGKLTHLFSRVHHNQGGDGLDHSLTHKGLVDASALGKAGEHVWREGAPGSPSCPLWCSPRKRTLQTALLLASEAHSASSAQPSIVLKVNAAPKRGPYRHVPQSFVEEAVEALRELKESTAMPASTADAGGGAAGPADGAAPADAAASHGAASAAAPADAAPAETDAALSRRGRSSSLLLGDVKPLQQRLPAVSMVEIALRPSWSASDFGTRVHELVHQIEHCGLPALAVVTHTELISELLASYVLLNPNGTARLVEASQRVHAAMRTSCVVVECTFSFSKSLAHKDAERPIMHFAMRYPSSAPPTAPTGTGGGRV